MFLSHDWGLSDVNHKRVARINNQLKTAGIKTWFDEERMRGNVNKTMAKGVEGAEAVVAFITKRYIEKASGENPQGENDNCYFEMNLVLNTPHLGVEKVIVVVMEPGMKAQGAWPSGTIKGKLCGKLHIDLTADEDAAFDSNMKALVAEIREVLPPGRVAV